MLVLGSLRSTASEIELQAIVPPGYVAFTARKSPVLYYFISKATSLPVHFILTDTRRIHPVAEVPLNSPIRPGIWPIRLRDLHIELEEEVQYRWYFSVTRNPESPQQDIVAGGIIERVNPSDVNYYSWPCDSDSIISAEEAGLWIDAFACAMELLEANPDDEALRRLRDRLL